MVALVLDMTKEQVCNGNEGRPQPELSISRFELKSEAPFKEKGRKDKQNFVNQALTVFLGDLILCGSLFIVPFLFPFPF